MKDFFRGLFFWLRGWSLLLRRPSLLLVAIVPFLVSLAMTIALVSWFYTNLPTWAQSFVQYALADFPTLVSILYYPLIAAGALVILAVGIFLAYLIQNIIAIPFYAILADRTLSLTGAKPGREMSWRQWWATTLHMLVVSLVKTAIFLFLGVLLLVCSFVPGLNLVALLGPLLLMAFDQLDYSFEALNFGFRARVSYMLNRVPLWLGMATGLGLTLFIPGLTLLIAPGAIVGAALLLHEGNKGS